MAMKLMSLLAAYAFLSELVPGNVKAEGKIRGFAAHSKVFLLYFYLWECHACISSKLISGLSFVSSSTLFSINGCILYIYSDCLQNWHNTVVLHNFESHLLGEDLGPLSVKELQQLEKQLECALSQARQRKVNI
jgi:hypothetical protein